MLKKFIYIHKSNFFTIASVGIILFAIILRILLAAFNWPPTNSDEGTMALMAVNIAYHGAHPYIYYGQVYMGVIEAYLGAFFFHLSGGPSLFALRLGVTLLTGLFLTSTYLLTRLLFSQKLAFVTLALLSVGSVYTLTRELIATGGTTQTLFFGSLAFLLASWLSLTYQRHALLRIRLGRFFVFGLYGLTIGLAMWSDMVSLPYLAMSFALLVIFCWREILLWGGWLSGIFGFFIGFLPSLLFDQAQGLNYVQVLQQLTQGTGAKAPLTIHAILHNIKNTIQVTIPTSTGLPFCPVNEQRFLGDNAPHTLTCTAIHGAWGLGYLLLVGAALIFFALQLSRLWLQSKTGQPDSHTRTLLVQHIAGLFMAGAALLNIVVFIFSSGPVNEPSFHARYLIGLLIITPAIIAPLWHAARRVLPRTNLQFITTYGSRVLLIAIALILCVGTLLAFTEIPVAQASTQQRQDLITRLEHLGITHVYTEYWTCNDIAFASNTHITCSVINSQLQTTHNRVPGLANAALKDPLTSWMCPTDPNSVPTTYYCLPALSQKFSQLPPSSYHRYSFDGYIIYQPLSRQ